MIVHFIRVTTLLSILTAGCAAATATPALTPTSNLNSRPADFNVIYKWQEGSLPPPYHYEYTITIEPDGQGKIVMIPDYGFNDPPAWSETFTIAPATLDQFYRLLIDRGLFTQRWQAQSDPPVGGGFDALRVTAHDRQIEIPSFVIATQAAAAEDIAEAMRALVPQTLWNQLNTQREQYVREHEQ